MYWSRGGSSDSSRRGAGPATRVVHRAAVFPSQAEKTGDMSDPVGMVLLDRLSYLLEFGY